MIQRPPVARLVQILAASPIFQGLDPPTLQALAQGAAWREVAAGEVVVLEGEAQPGLYYLHHGAVKVVKTSPAGREQILRFLEPGDTFNEIAVFTDQPNPATAIALEPAAIWIIPRAMLLRLLGERPAFARQVIANMAGRMLYLVSLVSDLSLRPVTGRLARLLLDEAQDDVLARPRWYTQAELAARLGTVPDVIQRALRQLDQDGLIAVERDQIRILDRPALEQAAS
jgi:CRP-like cAMP-binding protein